MTSANQHLLALLQAGLWNRPVQARLFGHDECVCWEDIYREAKRQAVLAVVFDGVCTLPSALYPPKRLVLQWYADVVRIEQANKHLRETLDALVAFYQRRDVNPILLKGEGVASFYPFPLHRQCGDIDLFVGTDYHRSKQLLEEVGIPWQHKGEKHFHYSYNHVTVENHRYAAVFYNPLRQRKLQRRMKLWLGGKMPCLCLSACQVRMLQPEFNIVYLLIHALQHFLYEGIGLRQLCDWALTVHVACPTVDWQKIMHEVRLLGLEAGFAAFAYVAVRYLGLSADCLPVPIEQGKELGELLLNDTLQGGNFGCGHKCRLVSGKGWRSYWRNYRILRVRCNKMKALWPAEAWGYPWFRALNVVNKKLKGLG